MSLISARFIIFLILILLVFRYIIHNNKAQRVVLLVCSYIFYGFFSIRFLIVLVLLSLWVWFVAEKISAKRCKSFLFIGISVCGIVLLYLKYSSFFIDSFIGLFGSERVGTLKVIAPLGISFYILQGISYIADVYNGKLDTKPLTDVLLYIGFFPQITAGPIVKAHAFFEMLYERKVLDKTRFSYAAQLFLIGLFKKVVIADRLNVGVNAVYNAAAQYSGLSLLFNAIAYSVQIYCDFSGYSDIAIAVAYALGFDYAANFDLPYIASNPSDFWRRWHISLSSWFRDYVYIPLGGNRNGSIRKYINLIVVFLLSGLWHGAALTFILWGLLHGILSVMYHVLESSNKSRLLSADIIKKAGVIFTVGSSWLLWIPFRADNISQAAVIVKRIFTWADGIFYISVYGVIYTVLIMASHVVLARINKGHRCFKPISTDKFMSKFILCLFLFLIISFAYLGDTAFIYANF